MKTKASRQVGDYIDFYLSISNVGSLNWELKRQLHYAVNARVLTGIANAFIRVGAMVMIVPYGLPRGMLEDFRSTQLYKQMEKLNAT